MKGFYNWRIRMKAKAKKEKVSKNTTTIIYILLVLFFILYILFQSIYILSLLIGACLLLTIIAALVIEFVKGFKESGAKKSIIEIITAIILVAVFWIALEAALGTSIPLDVVPSCSMLPHLQRGDLIVLQKATETNIKAPIINISSEAFNNMLNNMSNESLACVSYFQSGNTGSITQFYYKGEQIGFIKSADQMRTIVPFGYQNNNLIKYNCGITNVLLSNGSIMQEVYTNSITINNITINGDKNNSIVVYQTVPSDLFYKYGDTYIVHRAYAILNVSGTYYILTKGDNNPGLDIQYDNIPPSLNQVMGKVLFDIPYLGYLKLAMSSSFTEPAGCNVTLQDS